jgi:hypothetical protein
MSPSITVPTSIDSSSKLQTLINNTGNVPSEFVFSEDNEIEVSSLIRFFDYTKISGNGVTFRLKDNAPNFGLQVPVIGQKGASITGLEIEGLVYDGNYANQGNTPNDHGVGYGNLFGFSNITNSVFRNIQIDRNEGDGWRLNGGTNLVFDHCSGAEGGHDWLHLYKCSGAVVQDCSVEIRANNAVRVRSSSDVLIDSCKFSDITKNAWAPPVQLENLLDGTKCTKVEMKNCLIHDIKGPGVWGIASVPLGNAAGVHIHHNTFRNCGMMDKGNGIPGVGGTVFDGFTDVIIENNIFDSCYGNAVSFDNYIGKGGVRGCKAIVRKNSISNTKKAFYAGAVSGYGIANVLGKDYYTVEASGNVFQNNVSGNYYGAINISNKVDEPKEEPTEKPAFVIISCSDEDVTAIQNVLPEKQIFRRK